ncbi:hypothetical protein SteCoe_2023 [Stentor coeruleus]|uniref:Uncharacterized protein n=1 Tax=Stentor coeruleus TaxID=5963 RepID=A0A1R2D099_9CILI|nr:hypothetical protein SteCoe_2023 [Stentor coeruleus]
MEEVDDPRLERKIAEIRETLQKLGTSYTEDETSEFGKSANSSDDSFEKFYNYLSPRIANPIDKSPFNFESPVTRKEQKENKPKNLWEDKKEKLTQEDLEKGKCREKNLDFDSIKMGKEAYEKEIDSLHSLLQIKEKELNKAIFEKDLHEKNEGDLKKKLEEYKKREEKILAELNELRRSYENLEKEKTEISKALSNAKEVIETQRKSLRTKDEYERYDIKTEEDEKDREKRKGQTFDQKKFDFQRLRIPERIATGPSPERVDHNFTDRNDEGKYKKICHELMRIIGVSTSKELFPRFMHLRQHHLKNKKSKKLCEMISDMIIQCSPEGAFKEQPTIREIWKWITRLLEEYMKLKQTISGDTFYRLMELLQIENVDEIVDRVSSLVRNTGSYYP